MSVRGRDPPDPDRLQELFERALGRPPEDRERFLDEHAGSDPELRRELDSLLAHGAPDRGFLDRLRERVVAPHAGEALLDLDRRRLAEELRDRYGVRRRIGRGGMATVYLADDLRHGRQVAVKVLEPRVTEVVGAERFLAEIRTTASLQHPHIVPLFDSGEAGGLLYYVMPYVEGESLRDRLDRETMLPVDEAVRIATEVADALDHAHRQGIVHRDLKPGNVLLREGKAFLMDFGIALAVERADAAARLTETGFSLGTPLYMSPEQASGEESVGPRSDLYSLGCMLHEMLLGEPPHTGPTPRAILTRIMTDEVAPLTERRRSVPVHVDAAVRRTLEKLPADRFQSGEALAGALRDPGFRHGPPLPARTPAERPLPSARMPRTVVAGLAVAAAAGLGWWALAPGDPGAPPSLAVLPLEDMGGSGELGHLGEGIAEAITNALAKIPEIRVMGRSAFQLRGRDATEVADRLGVDAVLMGSFQMEGGSVRVSPQLVDGAEGFVLWSEQYDRPMESVIAIQEHIARSVARELRVELLEGGPRLVSAATGSPEAYDRYLRGRSEWNARGGGIRGSIPYFQEAVRIDPPFALAWSGLADAYVLLFEYGLAPADEAVPLARAAAERALELDPTLAEAHTSLAEVLAAEREWVESDRHFRAALRLNPGYVTANHWYGWLLAHLPHHEGAVAWLERAKELDPLSAIVRRDLADAYFIARRYEDAIEEARSCEALQIGGERCATAPKMMALELSGRLDEARALAEEAAGGEASPHLARVLARSGRLEEASAMLERWWSRVEADELSVTPTNPNVHVRKALIHLPLGEVEEALDALDRAIELGLGVGYPFRDWPMLDGIRDHPRYRLQLERMGYPDPPLEPLLPGDLTGELYAGTPAGAAGGGAR